MKFTKNALFTSATILIVPILLAIWLWWSEADMLFRAHEMSLFLPTKLYWETLAKYPGGTLCWLANWFTQFMYYPALGTTLMALLWILLTGITIYAFQLRGIRAIAATVTPILLLGCITQTGYWLYYQKMQGQFFVPTLGMLLSIMSVAIYRALPRKRGLRMAWMIIWGTASYPLMGAWGFMGTIMMAVPQRFEYKNWAMHIVAPIIVGALLVWLVPQLCYQQLYTQVHPDMLWRACMPTFASSVDDFPQYRIIYWMLLGSPLLTAGIGMADKIATNKAWTFCINIFTTCCVIGALFMTNKVWYRDANFHQEIRMHRAVQQQDWEEVLRLARQHTGLPPTRVMVWFRTLALFRLNRAGDEMFHFPDGGIPHNAPWKVKMSHVGGKQLYYQLGKENFCYRWCMEDCVEYGWSIENMTLMVKSSILQGDWNVAHKYINLLKKTLFYREWAQKYEQYIMDIDMMHNDPEMKSIRPMISSASHLDSDNAMVELFLINSFAQQHSSVPEVEEMSLICALLTRDISTFWPHFFRYCQHHQNAPIPTHYQEAAYLYSQLEPDRVDMDFVAIDEQVRKKYEDFMQFNQECGAMTTEQKKAAFQPQFGDTFYFFYFLQRNIKTN